jgi:hypothetical protein
MKKKKYDQKKQTETWQGLQDLLASKHKTSILPLNQT